MESLNMRTSKILILVLGLALPVFAASPAVPNFKDARWETVHLEVFGQSGIKIDKLTGEAWYQEKVNKERQWVSIPGPLSKAGKKSLSYGDNFRVESSASSIYLIGLRGGDSYRLADYRGKPYWRRIQ
jgi:hypothetical protein